MSIKDQGNQTTIQDTNIEEESVTAENTLKIFLRVDKRDEGVNIECNYYKADTNLLMQTIAYMLDVAYKGNRDTAVTVADMIPDIVKQYFSYKEAEEEVEEAEQGIEDVIKSMSEEAIRLTLKEALSDEELDTDMVMRLSSELMRREVQNDRERKKEKADDSSK